jgi:Domain of unknown function (DUF397)
MTDFDGAAISWRKSSFSQNGDCLEWCIADASILVRDSKDPHGTALVLKHSEWSAFLAAVKVASSGHPELDHRVPAPGGTCDGQVS